MKHIAPRGLGRQIFTYKDCYMNTHWKHPIISRCILFVGLISLTSFASHSMAGGDMIFHIEVETACMELTMDKEEYAVMSGVVAAYSKGRCPPVSSKGKKVFGGCKDLAGGETVWHYDMPDVQGANFKTEVKQDCAEWIPVDS